VIVGKVLTRRHDHVVRSGVVEFSGQFVERGP
jgi:hypothetical protein